MRSFLVDVNGSKSNLGRILFYIIRRTSTICPLKKLCAMDHCVCIINKQMHKHINEQ